MRKKSLQELTDFVLCAILFLVMFVTKRERSCCFTGHRVIAPEHREVVAERIQTTIQQLAKVGVTCFIAGGARGFDTLAAETVLALREEEPAIRLVLALPCKNQTRGWTAVERERYQAVLKQADAVYYLAEDYDSGCMMRRNRFMVENSSHCIFYLTRMQSGTYQTVKYAMEQGHTLHNILCKE